MVCLHISGWIPWAELQHGDGSAEGRRWRWQGRTARAERRHERLVMLQTIVSTRYPAIAVMFCVTLRLAEGGNCFKIVKMIMERNFAPVIVFSFSKKDCEAYAVTMMKLDFNTGSLNSLSLCLLMRVSRGIKFHLFLFGRWREETGGGSVSQRSGVPVGGGPETAANRAGASSAQEGNRHPPLRPAATAERNDGDSLPRRTYQGFTF